MNLLEVSAGRPITYTIFTIAHGLWHGDGVILPEIFGTKEQQLVAINSYGCNYNSIIDFIQNYLDQSKIPTYIEK